VSGVHEKEPVGTARPAFANISRIPYAKDVGYVLVMVDMVLKFNGFPSTRTRATDPDASPQVTSKGVPTEIPANELSVKLTCADAPTIAAAVITKLVNCILDDL